MFDWCSKIGCALKSVIGDIRIEKKVTSAATSDADLFESSKTEEPTIAVETEEIKSEKKEPIEITIHNSIYEYAHGKKFSNPPTWIVVHYTACANVSAKSMCKAMKNNTGASSHFYIDEKDIYAAVPLKYAAWHVCGGKVQQPKKDKEMTLEQLANYKTNGWRYDLAAKSHLKWQSEGDDFKGNYYSLGIDFCVKKKSTASKKATDTDWYFEDETIENVAKTVAYLANVYKIDDSHIITHCMATGKLCPQPFVWPPEKGDAKWEEFKEKVRYYRDRGVIAKWK
jgi:N-acetylmuramoyl-L-alanine amidase CwlA